MKMTFAGVASTTWVAAMKSTSWLVLSSRAVSRGRTLKHYHETRHFLKKDTQIKNTWQKC